MRVTWAMRLALAARWVGQRWCALSTGHHYIRQQDPGRLVLRCWYCDHESTGWTVTHGGTK